MRLHVAMGCVWVYKGWSDTTSAGLMSDKRASAASVPPACRQETWKQLHGSLAERAAEGRSLLNTRAWRIFISRGLAAQLPTYVIPPSSGRGPSHSGQLASRSSEKHMAVGAWDPCQHLRGRGGVGPPALHSTTSSAGQRLRPQEPGPARHAAPGSVLNAIKERAAHSSAWPSASRSPRSRSRKRRAASAAARTAPSSLPPHMGVLLQSVQWQRCSGDLPRAVGAGAGCS